MIAPRDHHPPAAMIVAGGHGRRMARTHAVPKPLVPLAGIPLIEIVVRKCLRAGFRPVTLALGHAAEEILAHVRGCGDLAQDEISSVIESEPLGTAGALSLLDAWRGTQLLVNGDLLSAIDLEQMLERHRRWQADLTIAVHFESHRLELGEVVTADEERVTDYLEKPLKQYRISSGTYLLEPSMCELIPCGQAIDVPDLVHGAVRAGRRVFAHVHGRPWIDVNDAALRGRAEQMLCASPEIFGVDRARVLRERSVS